MCTYVAGLTLKDACFSHFILLGGTWHQLVSILVVLGWMTWLNAIRQVSPMYTYFIPFKNNDKFEGIFRNQCKYLVFLQTFYPLGFKPH